MNRKFDRGLRRQIRKTFRPVIHRYTSYHGMVFLFAHGFKYVLVENLKLYVVSCNKFKAVLYEQRFLQQHGYGPVHQKVDQAEPYAPTPSTKVKF